jgi:2'-5' RNA ligase
MLCDSGGQDLINSFALVTYIPDPLGKFLDDLRRDLAPGCVPHAHVTLLPPRSLDATPQEATEAARALLSDVRPFEIEVARVEIFPVSDVLYITIGEGRRRLIEMHRKMNVGTLEFREPFSYEPHVTLAQDLTQPAVAEAAATARQRWSEYPYQRMFTVESLTFVQNTSKNVWVDLAHFQLDPALSIHR